MSLNLKHRHETYSTNKPNLINAYDDVVVMVERGQSILHLVQGQLVEGQTVEDNVLFASLCAVSNELSDIEALLKHLVDAHLDNRKA